MKHKKKIKNDILKILRDSGIANETQNKILARLVNYTYKVRTETINSSVDIASPKMTGVTVIEPLMEIFPHPPVKAMV